jgi:non-ribosomal peptide synthetase component E (peptide arylation enzyme)
MPMIHNACMVCCWCPTLITGAAYTIPADMTPESWGKVFREKKPTWVGLIRSLIPRLEAMIEGGMGSLDSVRAIWCPDAARYTRETFGIPSYPMFGMSEGMNMYTKITDPIEAQDWTVGRPMSKYDEVRLLRPGTDQEVGLDEVGEMTVRGPYTVAGYYNAPERNQAAFTPDGFYRSGDLMVKRKIGEEVFYAFAGRNKDVISRGHEKVNCEELEHAISTVSSVANCAVVGMPDKILGERICAYLVIKENYAPPTVAQLGDHLREIGLAKFKWPERIEVVHALPLSKIGKLDKEALRQDIVGKLQREPASVASKG